jgi:hypothetical protein
MDEAAKYDEEAVDSWRDNLDVLLVFVRILSYYFYFYAHPVSRLVFFPPWSPLVWSNLPANWT